MNPQFDRELLTASLKAEGIGYAFLGKELGPDGRILPVRKMAKCSSTVSPALRFSWEALSAFIKA
jgi:hypothetical protein